MIAVLFTDEIGLDNGFLIGTFIGSAPEVVMSKLYERIGEYQARASENDG